MSESDRLQYNLKCASQKISKIDISLSTISFKSLFFISFKKTFKFFLIS